MSVTSTDTTPVQRTSEYSLEGTSKEMPETWPALQAGNVLEVESVTSSPAFAAVLVYCGQVPAVAVSEETTPFPCLSACLLAVSCGFRPSTEALQKLCLSSVQHPAGHSGEVSAAVFHSGHKTIWVW